MTEVQTSFAGPKPKKSVALSGVQAGNTALYCLMDTLACGLQALKYPACTKLLGPVVPGAVMSGGSRVPGTSFELDPVQAAFNIGTMIRWLDFNDTWLAAEWGHPSDNLGGILAVADFGRLTAADYEDDVAHDPRIDTLRSKMTVRENSTFTQEYYAPDKRYIGNAVQVFFRDGSATRRIQVDFPIGHRKRREEGMPVLAKKFESSVNAHFESRQAARVNALFADAKVDDMPVNEFIDAMSLT